jgi:peptidyl-dipeptidase Dcp
MKLNINAPPGSLFLVALFFLVLIAACQTAPPATRTEAPAEAAPSAAPAPTAARDAAAAEVARLTAIADQDPLLKAWEGPYGGVPPWDKLDVAGFGKAFETGLALLLAEVDVIAENPEPPTFANTFVPLEDAGRHTDRSQTLFSVLTNNLSTPEAQAVDKEWSPKIAAAYDKIVFNSKLFARVAAIHEGRDKLKPEERRLVELSYDRFVRAGANLSAEDKAKVGKINEELAGLFTDFGNKVLADENSWTVLESKKDLAGLSPSLVAAYKAAADERDLAGKWAVVNTRSSVDPFLASSSRRDLREKVWKAFKNRGDNGGENDTNATIARIVKLRADRAKLLGFATHAHWRMADTMARDPEKAKALLLRVWPAAVARVGV